MNPAGSPSLSANAATVGEPGETPSDAGTAAQLQAIQQAPTNAHRQSHRTRSERDAAHFAAVALVGTAVLIGLGVQCSQLLSERARLAGEFSTQARAVEDAEQFRARLDRLARETHKLGEQGYPIGRQLIEKLRKQGILIDLTADPPVAHLGRKAQAPAK